MSGEEESDLPPADEEPIQSHTPQDSTPPTTVTDDSGTIDDDAEAAAVKSPPPRITVEGENVDASDHEGTETQPPIRIPDTPDDGRGNGETKGEDISTTADATIATEAINGSSTDDRGLNGDDVSSSAGTDLPTRTRTDSRSTTATRSMPVSSTVFIVTALESIGNSKEARRSKEFGDAVQAALSNIQSNDQAVNPELIFRPLQLATKSFSVPLQVTALDCIGKLISYSYFAFPSVTITSPDAQQPESAETPPLIERAIEAICDCFEGEATAIEIQQQIIKSLLAAVLDDKIVVHGAGLLKAVRQIYNIFIYSKSSQNQAVAQGSLTQMVATVFERVKVRLEAREVRAQPKSEEDLSLTDEIALNGLNGTVETPDTETPPVLQSDGRPAMTLKDFENNRTLDDAVAADSAPTMVTRARERKGTRNASGAVSRSSMQEDREESELSVDDEDEIYIKDAFLVFRSLCKLSQKVLTYDQQQDPKSQNMRSKLLSLHLIHHTLINFTIVFNSPQSTLKGGPGGESNHFIEVAKPHLCLSLSRNASSSVSRIFEVCAQIFWLCLKHLRVALKKELEVFLKEIYLAVLDKRTAPQFQKQMFMDVLEKLSSDARALVEIYLNYDCDRTALDNMYQSIIEHLSRICSTPVAVSPQQQVLYQEQNKAKSHHHDWHSKGSLLPSLSTSTLSHSPPQPPAIPAEYLLKQQSLKCLIEILTSLDHWSGGQVVDSSASSIYPPSRSSMHDSRDSLDTDRPPPSPRAPTGFDASSGVGTPIGEDDPSELERVRRRKIALNEAIRQFNFKPKKGIKLLLADGFIRSDAPEDIARFLLSESRLDKASLGEFLGEGDEFNVAIMHKFVDQMNFTKRRFVEALRQFLQSFRLPGEAQKSIDSCSNSLSAISLATLTLSQTLIQHQHSAQVKKRMTPEDFIKNNRGINDGQDLPPEYLTGIYEEIQSNEIVLSSEREQAADKGIAVAGPSTGLASRAVQGLANVGRDLQSEKYNQASEDMAARTELLYRSLIRAQRRTNVREVLSKFIPATSVKHVGSMFNVTWMSFLSAISSQMQDAQNFELIKECLNGLRLAIRISCRFDLDTPRTAFVTSLAKFTNLGNLKEMMAKHLEALKVLIDIALTEGDLLRSSWREILTCISQLDRLQLLSTGVDENSVPDVNRASIPTPSNAGEPRSRKSQQGRRPRPKSGQSFRPEVADETKSSDMTRSIDRIFSNTAKLSSDGIVDFVAALTAVSWQEIQSSGNSESPRTYSLQKLVEISYYNMTRVRIEWTRLWDVLGEHFNQVGCHNNTHVVFFALDSLRQLSMRFLEIEELPGFRFQKDFLKPFEYVMANNTVVSVKDMVLRCLIQMIQARGENIRSGWKTMFGVFTVAADEQYEAIVNIAFDYTNQIYKERFGVVITQGSFPDLIQCLTQFSKNIRFQKKSLQALELLKSTVPKMLKTPECPLSRRHSVQPQNGVVAGVRQPSSQTEEEQFWYPVLLAYQDILMTGDDLEVRSRALNYLFETLIRYGGDFPPEFWDMLWRQILYPIFVVLQSKTEMSKVPNHEELSVWLSTTMIQALRNMITLFTHYFESLESMLDRFLGLLALCICQENDTIARIGSNCLQQLILHNVTKFKAEHWAKIVGAFVDLFNRTTAYDLFSAAATMSDARSPQLNATAGEGLALSGVPVVETPTEESSSAILDSSEDPASTTTTHIPSDADQPLEEFKPASALFNKIITNCVLQLLMIETVAELFSNDTVYAQIPSNELLRLMGLLKKSYQFAKRFNGDRELRQQLWRQGFMRQPPNLLKQESGSANTYVQILLRMYSDEGEERRSSREETEGALIPLCADILRAFTALDEESQQRNIVAWRPVVIDVLEGYTNFPAPAFEKHIDTFYPLGVNLLEKEVGFSGGDMRAALWGLFRRVGEVKFGMPEYRGRQNSLSGSVAATPTSPSLERREWLGNGGDAERRRRGSRLGK
ncbi:Protein transport protein SEC7 [Cyphellophora attinorum]|uniref:Protein transport protein SEC7 n=1 Tax=Cyphellophora attinorum TaxID=1664694 RepID=A0A0N1HKF4_9EURO|nr:Protein transport protein SEC7 [Phialophora attinorum]KPI34716.1 Protein transport protein SEC7 [Phialophora attinorum]